MGEVLLFTIATGKYEQWFNTCIESHRAYCTHYHIDYAIVSRTPRGISARESAWLKIPLMSLALDKGYSWVCFMDCDCEIRDHAPAFAPYFGTRYPRGSIFLAKGYSGRPNSGVIIARNDAESRGFLRQVTLACDKPLAREDQAPYENGAVIHFARTLPGVCTLEDNRWNNNDVIDPDAYVQHYSGGALRKWFIENRTSPMVRKAMARWAWRGRMKGFLNFCMKRKMTPISKSLAELLPYYVNTFDSPT